LSCQKWFYGSAALGQNTGRQANKTLENLSNPVVKNEDVFVETLVQPALWERPNKVAANGHGLAMWRYLKIVSP
jgi:hypothetical protein